MGGLKCIAGICSMFLAGNAMAVTNPLQKIPLGKAFLNANANLRLRYEYQNNYNIKKYTNTRDDYLLERLRFNTELKTQKRFKLFIQFQDSHSIGCKLKNSDFKGKSPYVNELDLRQAYIEWNRINNSAFGFKIGRQQISYRDNRVFGPGSWGNVGRYTWDAIMLKYEIPVLSIDAFFAKRIFYLPEKFLDKYYPYDVYAVYMKIKKLPVIFDAFSVFKYNKSDVTDEFGNFFPRERRYTFGFYFKGKSLLKRRFFLDYSGLFAYQTGSYSSRKLDISAYGWYFNLGLDYKFYVPQSLWAKYSYGSGDKDPNDNKYQTFDGLFGGMAKYFGRMNLFCWSNIKDYQLSYHVKPLKNLKLIMDYHWFYLAQKTDYWYYFNCKPVSNRRPPFPSDYLGKEWDAFVIYNLSKNLQFQLGLGRFYPGTAIIKTGFHEKADYFIFQTFFKF